MMDLPARSTHAPRTHVDMPRAARYPALAITKQRFEIGRVQPSQAIHG